MDIPPSFFPFAVSSHNQFSRRKKKTFSSISFLVSINTSHSIMLASKSRIIRQLLLRGLSTQVKKAAPSVTKAEVPPQLHLMAGYMEYLDTALAKTEKLDSSMKDLKKTYTKKRDLKQTIKWTDPSEMDKLFIQAEEQKEDIAREIAELRQLLQTAKKVFAVVSFMNLTSSQR
jgi:CHASE3 domain sensor protein